MKLYLMLTVLAIKIKIPLVSVPYIPLRSLSEFFRKILFALRSFYPGAPLFTSVLQPDTHEITDVSSGNETETADKKDLGAKVSLHEPFSSLFESQ